MFFSSCIYILVYLLNDLILIGKYNRLEKEKIARERWILQRKDAVEFQRHEGYLRSGLVGRSFNSIVKSFSRTSLLLLVSNFLLMMANALAIMKLFEMEIADFDLDKTFRRLMGVGSFFAWVNVLSLLSLLESFTVVSKSIKKTVKSLSFLIFGVLPLFFAFLFGGFCAFHENEKFESLTKTNVTLSAILVGDEIMEFIRALTEYGQTGIIYSFLFCVVFIVCIHNVFLFVITESFKVETSDYEKQMDSKKKIKKEEYLAAQKNKTIMSRLEGANGSSGYYTKSVLSEQFLNKQEVINGKKEIGDTHRLIFTKVVPESRNLHLYEMNGKKEIIKQDIHFLKETIQNLLQERMNQQTKDSLLITSWLYQNFLLKRLVRMEGGLRNEQMMGNPDIM